ncbi:uncharacterized protein [Dermacentor andersoni]|uniref:uncharacterized protein isoform X5 n=1 Tax=Dermacentor andersoni TaxID=34620 RepID=UPI003B3B68E3
MNMPFDCCVPECRALPPMSRRRCSRSSFRRKKAADVSGYEQYDGGNAKYLLYKVAAISNRHVSGWQAVHGGCRRKCAQCCRQQLELHVWLAVLVCIICLSCLLALSSWKTLSIRRRNCATFFHWAYCYCWELLGLLFTESSPRRYSLTSQRLLVTVWLMTVVVLSNSFGSLLKSKQAVFNFKPEVDGVDDLAARPHLTPIIPRGNYFEAFAEYSPSKSVKKVWERSRARGAFYMPTQLFSDSTMAQVAAHRAVVLCERGSILFHMAGFCERQNIRTFVVASQPLDKSPYGYIFSQHFDEDFFRKLFVKFRRLQETGLMPKWMADSQGKWERCIQSKDNIVKSISLMDTMPFFLLWGFMCGLAFCALLSELGLTRLLQGLRASRH